MPPSGSTLRVNGLAGLTKAFAVADRNLKKELRSTLRDVAEPVRRDAEVLGLGRITNLGVEWSRMRVGVTSRAVYVAPKARGVRRSGNQSRKRPKLAGLLMDKSMQPALDQNVGNVERGMERMLNEIGRDWERVV